MLPNGLEVMSKTYSDIIEHTTTVLDAIENELRCTNIDTSPEDLYYIYFKVSAGIRKLDAMSTRLNGEIDHYPLLNELHRCQDILHKIQSNHDLVKNQGKIVSDLVKITTRFCDSIFTSFKKVYENGLVIDFL